jgi:hypothetical protein
MPAAAEPIDKAAKILDGPALPTTEATAVR